MLPKRTLTLMVKPPPPIALMIHGFAETDPRRGPDLLHWTVQYLGDRLDCVLNAIVDAIDGVALEPFRLVFDRLAAGEGARLIPRERLRGAERFCAAMSAALVRAGLDVPKWSRPHITLNYRDALRPHSRSVDPISWEVEEIILVESLYGAARHNHLKRWQLRKA